MEKPDVTALAQKMIEAVKAHVSRAVGAVVTRLEELEQRVEGLPAPEKGDQGTSVTVEDVAPLITEQVGKAIEAFPRPKNGRDADPETVRAMVAEAVAAIPKPQDGKSVALEDVVPLVDKAVAAIPKPKDGEDGKSVHPDTVALMVREAVDKAVAAAVASMPRPKDGRDALELVPLPSIDEARSYPAGTWATYNGGEIRAARQTDPVKEGNIIDAGWAVMRDGVAALVVLQDDNLRKFTVSAQLTSGKSVASEFALPVVLDRGVWEEGKAYAKGDHVSWAGSGWIAQVDTTSKPDIPGGGGWRLSAKRGKDGVDADQLELRRSNQRSSPVRLK